MRCLVLADALRRAGAETTFLARDQPGHVTALAGAAGHAVTLLDPSPDGPDLDLNEDSGRTRDLLAAGERTDWVVVDHYGLDARWESAVREHVRCVLVVDDLADRAHVCDILLDPGDHDGAVRRYQTLVPRDCVVLLGPRYALLREEFLEARRRARPRDGRVRRILVSFGGSDPTNQTAQAIEGLRRVLRSDISIDVVLGSSNPHRSKIAQLCSSLPSARMHVQVESMAALMETADLALGAGGVEAWERCAVGLPSIVTVVAENQRASMQRLARRGALWLAGSHPAVATEHYVQLLESALRDPAALQELSRTASGTMDGCERGVAECVALMQRKAGGDRS